MQATAKWSTQLQFAGTGNGGHPLLMDGESKAGNSPMELVLLALCGCTAYDVVSILQKKREPFTALEVSAEAEKAVEDAVRLSEEKYCSIAAMLNKTARSTYEIRLDED